jgi:hypothetical protein
LAGNFFREYIAPVASRYRERIDLEATLCVGGSGQLKRGTVEAAWRKSLSAAGQSGALALIEDSENASAMEEDESEREAIEDDARASEKDRKVSRRTRKKRGAKTEEETNNVDDAEPQYAPRNKVIRNKGDPVAVRQAKAAARAGKVSDAIQQWLFPPPKPRQTGLPRDSLLRFSDATPALVLNDSTIRTAVVELSKDPKLAAVLDRVGAEALITNFGNPEPPTQAGLFNYCLRSITFSQVSVDAGNSCKFRWSMEWRCS